MPIDGKGDRLLLLVSLLNPAHKVPEGILQTVSQPQQDAKRRLFTTYLDECDVGPVKLAYPCQILLRKTQLPPAKFDFRC